MASMVVKATVLTLVINICMLMFGTLFIGEIGQLSPFSYDENIVSDFESTMNKTTNIGADVSGDLVGSDKPFELFSLASYQKVVNGIGTAFFGLPNLLIQAVHPLFVGVPAFDLALTVALRALFGILYFFAITEWALNKELF